MWKSKQTQGAKDDWINIDMWMNKVDFKRFGRFCWLFVVFFTFANKRRGRNAAKRFQAGICLFEAKGYLKLFR